MGDVLDLETAREGSPAGIAASLDALGHADLGPLFDPATCDRLAGMFDEERPFRSHIVMRRHGFGEGEYKYFANPLPGAISDARRALYARLVGVANTWEAALGTGRRFPQSHEAFLDRCHADGQSRPTPLLLRYRAGDYNCLHQDLYGAHTFPLQVVVLLSDPDAFEGGEFVMTEQRPRMQSRAEVVPLRRGHALAFAVNARPRQGTRGIYRVKQRHGVSRLRRGERFTLGIIFHDAE
ncbi:MAG: 2OG-Fe(II) oxygenase [Pseudomonadota bacterium]